jgi:hypothetical protein
LDYLLLKSHPSRTALVAGYGRNAQDEFGERKAALVNGIGIDPLTHTAYARYKKTGTTRPGDSGGPVLVLSGEKALQFAVTSGSNAWITEGLEGQTYDPVERYSPIVPSLCLAGEALIEELNLTASVCDRISQFTETLRREGSSARAILLRAHHQKGNGIRSVAAHYNDLPRYLLATMAAGVESYLFYDFFSAQSYRRQAFYEDAFSELVEDSSGQLAGIFADFPSVGAARVRMSLFFENSMNEIRERKSMLYGNYKSREDQAFHCGSLPCLFFLEGWQGPRASAQISWDEYFSYRNQASASIPDGVLKSFVCSVSEWIESATRVPDGVPDEVRMNTNSVERFANIRDRSFSFELDAISGGVGISDQGRKFSLGFEASNSKLPFSAGSLRSAFELAGFSVEFDGHEWIGSKDGWDHFYYDPTNQRFTMDLSDDFSVPLRPGTSAERALVAVENLWRCRQGH